MSDEPGNLKSRIDEIKKNIRVRAQSFLTPERLKSLDPAKASEWASGLFQRQRAGFYGKILTIVLCTFFLGDLSAILVGNYLPEPSPPPQGYGYGSNQNLSFEEYNVIMARNLFNSKGHIPGENVAGPAEMDLGGPPVKTTLPFTLIGTMVLRDELRSVATIEDKSVQQVYPVRMDDEIPEKAKILKIEPRRVIFLNLTNHRREYVDLPKHIEANLPHITLGQSNQPGGTGIQKVASDQYVVSRSEVNRALSNLNNILTQARAVPNFENGRPAGYKLFQIVPGSIYSKLGLQDGDVICGFDGQPANDPAAAFEKLSNLKNTSHLDLCVKRNGQQHNYSYDFR